MSSHVFESEWVAREGGGGGGMSGGRTNINCDAVDARFKLRSHSKITFDIGSHLHDKKSKYCCTLELF